MHAYVVYVFMLFLPDNAKYMIGINNQKIFCHSPKNHVVACVSALCINACVLFLSLGLTYTYGTHATILQYMCGDNLSLMDLLLRCGGGFYILYNLHTHTLHIRAIHFARIQTFSMCDGHSRRLSKLNFFGLNIIYIYGLFEYYGEKELCGVRKYFILVTYYFWVTSPPHHLLQASSRF